MHFPCALTLISLLMITTFDKLHMFSKTFDCPFVPFSVFDSSISFTPRLLFWLWCDSLHRESVQTTENQLDAEKEKKDGAPNLTMWHSAWVKRVRISPAREHSLRLSARDHSPLLLRHGRALDSALCNGPCCCVPRPPPPGLIIEPIQNGVNG